MFSRLMAVFGGFDYAGTMGFGVDGMTEHGEHRAVRFGEFVLDPREERVVGLAGEVRVGRKAFRLLSALIERPGSC